METVGAPLPVLVCESLVACAAADCLSDVSVCLSPDGWCWMVVARRLFVWRYCLSADHEAVSESFSQHHDDGRASSAAITVCYELPLPASDVAHRSHLVQLTWHPRRHRRRRALPGCVAVSPVGCVRHWPSVAQADVSSQLTVERQLAGEECQLLTRLDPTASSCLLATSTCSLLVLRVADGGGGVGGAGGYLQCRSVQTSSGLLSGLGRRVSSMFWGSLASSASVQDTLVCVDVAPHSAPTDERLEQQKQQQETHVAYLLSCGSLQKWALNEGGAGDCLLYQWPVVAMATDAVSAATIGERSPRVQLHDMKATRVWRHDEQCVHLVLLISVSWQPDRQTRLYVGRVQDSLCSQSAMPTQQQSQQQPQWLSFEAVRVPASLELRDDEQMRLLLTKTAAAAEVEEQSSVSVYTRRHIVSVEEGTGKVQVLALSSSSAQILGAGLSPHGVALFCTSHQGLIGNRVADRATAVSAVGVVSATSSALCDDISRADNCDWRESQEQQPSETGGHSDNVEACLRAAWNLFARDRATVGVECDRLLMQLLSPSSGESAASSALHKAVCSLSRQLIDQHPRCDPRWTHVLDQPCSGMEGEPSADVAAATTAPPSVLLATQLQEKRVIHALFVDFLRHCAAPRDASTTAELCSSLWQRLDGVMPDDDDENEDAMSMQQTVARHHELLVLASTMCSLPGALARLLESCLARVITPYPPPAPLTSRDLFFRRVSACDMALAALVDAQSILLETAATDHGRSMHVTSVVDSVLDTSQLVVECVTAVWQCASTASHPMRPQSPAAPHDTSDADVTSGAAVAVWPVSEPVCELLQTQHMALAVHTVRLLGSSPHDARLPAVHQLLLQICDLLLAARQSQASWEPTARAQDASTKRQRRRRYETQRHDLLRPLIEAGQYESAASLAEKYGDYRALIEVCERSNNVQRRQFYLQKYAGFADCLFDWYVERGERGRLVDQCCLSSQGGGGGGGEMRQQLEHHVSLRWLAQLCDGRWSAAADSLLHCGQAEERLLARRKTYLSLAKLACLAADDGDDELERQVNGEGKQSLGDMLTSVDDMLHVVELQEKVCDNYVDDETATGDQEDKDDDKQVAQDQRVMSISSLIDHITHRQSKTSGEDEVLFAQALALCRQLEDSQQDARLTVWRRALQRDHTALLQDQNGRVSPQLFVFRVAEAARLVAAEDDQLQLPPVEQLLAAESLRSLRENAAAVFQLRAGYERLATVC